jgi:hypothetical protein
MRPTDRGRARAQLCIKEGTGSTLPGRCERTGRARHFIAAARMRGTTGITMRQQPNGRLEAVGSFARLGHWQGLGHHEQRGRLAQSPDMAFLPTRECYRSAWTAFLAG